MNQTNRKQVQISGIQEQNQAIYTCKRKLRRRQKDGTTVCGFELMSVRFQHDMNMNKTESQAHEPVTMSRL